MYSDPPQRTRMRPREVDMNVSDGEMNSAGARGLPMGRAALTAMCEDIDSAGHEQRPPFDPPELEQCQASDLKVPKSTSGIRTHVNG